MARRDGFKGPACRTQVERKLRQAVPATGQIVSARTTAAAVGSAARSTVLTRAQPTGGAAAWTLLFTRIFLR